MEGLKKKIFGVCLKNDLAQPRNETKGINYESVTLETSKQLEEFLHLLLIKREVIQNFELLFHIVNVAVKITDANLSSDDIWHSILKLRFSSEIKIDEDCKVLNYLIEIGIATENPISWKCLAVVSTILSSVPRSKTIIVKLIETEYAKKIGQLFDNIQDLQQGNFLVRILSNCFVKSDSSSKKVERIPQLWQSRSKNKFFFENKFYPLSGKHGSSQTCRFLCNNFISTLLFTGILRQVSYSGSEALKNLRILKKKEDGNESSYFIQCIYNKIYLWLDEEAPLEFERKKIRIIKNLKNKIQIKLRHPFHECVRTTADNIELLFNKTRGFQLEFEDEKLGEAFFHNVNNIPKISEVQTFLVLDYIEEEPEDEGEEEEQIGRIDEPKEDEEGESLDELSTPMSYPIKSSISRNEKVQLVTPDRSVSIRSDEWDLKSSTEDGEDNVTLTDLKINSTKDTKRPRNYVHIDSEDQSPVVSAQMRKMRRESTKTLEILRQEFKDKDVQNEERPSEQIQEAFLNTSSLVVGKSRLVNHKEKPNIDQKVIGITELKSNSSIKKRDINILDTIFGQPPSKKQKQFHKKEKKQQKKLTNFKPIIDVPSQDKRNLRSNAPTKPKSIKVNKLRTHKEVTGEKSITETTAEKVNDQAVHTNNERMASDASEKKGSSMNEEHDKLQENCSPDVNESKEITRDGAKVSLQSEKRKETFTNSSVVENHNLPDKDCNNCNITDILESTTVIDLYSPHGSSVPGQNSFTNKLQEQIYSSINHFSNELVRKISIINQELNTKILKELSEKYQKLFSELQDNFQNDTNEMLKFMGEIKDMINLPEDQLVHAIRTRKFNNNGG
ncbi:Red1p [Saccharomyces paradoxus]|uniref:Red1p n=1 Tax=Saccharomyces paradoxus TaxID=27291 RepID=A0A8B8UW72_SACPA|nr:Red1 [Saccharomyces paradoxus]QHS74980.1 Red1 [Saccharomyces paradoxus]